MYKNNYDISIIHYYKNYREKGETKRRYWWAAEENQRAIKSKYRNYIELTHFEIIENKENENDTENTEESQPEM